MLVAPGLTNRQIARSLVIAGPAAYSHVGTILSSLGLVTRAQVATWVVEQGLYTPRSG